ncbi:thiol reductant ABC exporter subunit CydC [Marinococcus luteus]|uniref:thiol reductant ABC exporter subunit CydC n=1 Tax=Marinococcus luteus TaxID=1122204 RepID=UPI002ACD03C5|nr:thiol reductant ABC exporter subunit CydC [Marinococcus luteus]MDZ5784358.1 thiol reductant ABC exporter subunit CydC [Marinococcus luteus]
MKGQWILPYVKKYKRGIAWTAFFGLLASISAVALLFVSGFLLTKSATQPENILMVYIPIVAVRAFGVSRAVFRYAERLAAHQAVLKILSDMRVRLYRGLLPVVEKGSHLLHAGDMLGLLAEDIERLQDIYIKTVMPAVSALALYLLSALWFGFFSWGMGALAAVYALIYMTVVPYWSYRRTASFVQKWKPKRAGLYKETSEAVFGIGEWLLSGRFMELAGRFRQADEAMRSVEWKYSRFIRARGILLQTVTAGLVLIVLVWAGSGAEAGSLTPTLVAAFALFIFPLTETLIPISEAVGELPRYTHSTERLNRLEAEEDLQDSQSWKPEYEEKHIFFDDVSFHYEASQPVLKHLQAEWRPGCRVALLGPSGSGKSTVLNLLRGVCFPFHGEVVVEGRPASAWGERITEKIAVLNQSPYLFSTTVENNIRLGRPDASIEEVKQAARQAQIYDAVNSLPEGFHTNMQEAGARFSGGQRQRIALARVLLQDTPIVVLDEPAVGLDPRTEQALMDDVLQSLEGKTVIWITHHLSGLEQVDEICFLDQGRITMRGTHEDLMHTSPRYQRLYELDRPTAVLQEKEKTIK